MVPCFPLLGLTPSGLLMGLSGTIIYTSELILCSTICVPSATRHNIRNGDCHACFRVHSSVSTCRLWLLRFLRRSVIGKHLMCFQSETSDFKFFRRSEDRAQQVFRVLFKMILKWFWNPRLNIRGAKQVHKLHFKVWKKQINLYIKWNVTSVLLTCYFNIKKIDNVPTWQTFKE